MAVLDCLKEKSDAELAEDLASVERRAVILRRELDLRRLTVHRKLAGNIDSYEPEDLNSSSEAPWEKEYEEWKQQSCG